MTPVLEVSGDQGVVPLLASDDVPEQRVEDDVRDRVESDKVRLEKHPFDFFPQKKILKYFSQFLKFLIRQGYPKSVGSHRHKAERTSHK